ncbi:MAG TPA: hypothetical protein VK348_08875 [Planctomycetota bacterium]|nr:hypothetical protein [Planctomycetota bacterium]
MRSSSSFLLALGVLGATLSAQTVIVPQQAATAEGNSATSYPWNPCLNATCSIRVQYFYTRNAFLNQGITTPIAINNLRWRADGGAVSAGGITFTGVQIELSTATPGAILAPNPTFANNHGADRTLVFPSGPVTTLPTTGTVPNGFLASVAVSPFVYDPNAGDLCVDIINNPGVAGGPATDQITTLGADGARVWDFTPGATVQNPASGNNQPGLAITMEIGYIPPANFATAVPYGTGCYRTSRSFYENFTTSGSFDLANSSMTLLNTGSSYVATPGGTFVTPSGTATTLGLTDDSETTVPLTGTFNYPGGSTGSLQVCSNGFVSAGVGNGVSYVPSSSAWLTSVQARWGGWHDYLPASAGTTGVVQFEQIGTIAYVTWVACPDYGVPGSASTWQLQFDTSNGTVVYAWGAMSLTGGSHLVGFAAQGTSNDLGSRDISATLPGSFSTGASDATPVALAASARPRTGTSINLVTTNCPANSTLGVNILGFTQIAAGVPWIFAGMDGCLDYVGLAGISPSVFFPAGGTGTTPLTIPNNPGLNGLVVVTQSGVLATGFNPFGALSSNGVRMVINPN